VRQATIEEFKARRAAHAPTVAAAP
jgi:hypothetical protein